MATFRDDIARAGRRVLEVAQERSGYTAVRRDELQETVQEAADARVLRKELEYVGYTILNHAAGEPHELRPESRRQLALKSLNAYISDPHAAAVIDHYVAFVLGRGVPRPQARDPEVQKRLDLAWKDRANQRHLTSAERLRERAVDYGIESNVPFLFFEDGQDGMVRMSTADMSTFETAYRHPEERARILYYVAREREMRWDPASAREVVVDPNAQPKTWYYEAIDAFDDADTVEVMDDVGLWRPPASQTKRGRLLLISGAKPSKMTYAVPQFKRMLRWFTAYNEVIESYADRMKAAAKLYMKASVTGGKSAVERAGLMAVRRGGGLATPEPVEGLHGPGHGGIPGRGALGMVAQNEGVNYEPFKVDSGASDVAAAAPVMRGVMAAGAHFPGHYFGGDPGSLAGSQSVELPVLKFIELEQETWAKPFRVLADRTIAKSVELGFLDEWRDPTDRETQAIEAGTFADEVSTDGRVRRDLSYDFALPNPLQRAMGDVVTAAVQTATAVDPNGDFPDLSRWLFGFILAEAFDVADPQKIVDEILPLERIREMEDARREQQALAQAGARAAAQMSEAEAAAASSTTGADGRQHPPGNPGGARQQAPNPEDRTQQAAVTRPERAARLARRRRPVDMSGLERVVGTQLESLAAAYEPGHNDDGGQG
jgi:hypothetical protein